MTVYTVIGHITNAILTIETASNTVESEWGPSVGLLSIVSVQFQFESGCTLLKLSKSCERCNRLGLRLGLGFYSSEMHTYYTVTNVGFSIRLRNEKTCVLCALKRIEKRSCETRSSCLRFHRMRQG